jgi:alpha-tubulin suppressor-like RCC1 family protein
MNLFVAGSGQYGELGLGSLQNQPIPKINSKLYTSEVVQIACGEKHSLCIVSPAMQVYAFGYCILFVCLFFFGCFIFVCILKFSYVFQITPSDIVFSLFFVFGF